VGFGPGLRGAVLIVQSNAFNENRIATVIVALINSNLALKNAPRNVRVSKSDSGLPKLSVVNVSQLLTIDRTLLTDRVKALPQTLANRVNDGLRLVLAI
jgi:mRNA interferase MazF